MKMRRMTERQKLEQLQSFVAMALTILHEAHSKVEDIAGEAGLSMATIYRLFNRDYTIRVQWRTIQAISEAAGLELILTDTHAEVRNVA